jgi:hypothetical protein
MRANDNLDPIEAHIAETMEARGATPEEARAFAVCIRAFEGLTPFQVLNVMEALRQLVVEPTIEALARRRQ